MLASESERVMPNEPRFKTKNSAELVQVDKIFDGEDSSLNEGLTQVLIPFRLFVFFF